MTLLLTNEDVEQVLDMPASVSALEPAYRDLVRGPRRLATPDPDLSARTAAREQLLSEDS